MTELFTVYNFFIFVLCYIIGSFPTTYLLVKIVSKKDITKEGSGNVGTLNSFQVSKSKTIGIVVLLFDLLKGALPVYIMLFVMNTQYPSAMLGACALILGHNYPVWLKFKGGRGLATGAGIFAVINYYILIGWCVVWLVIFLFKRSVLTANTAATFGLPVCVLLVNIFSSLEVNSNLPGYTLNYFTIYSIIISIIILTRHTEVFKNEQNSLKKF